MRLPLDVSNIKIVDENNFILLADYDNNSYNLNDLKGEEREKAIKEIEENKDYEVLDEIPFWSNGHGFRNKKRDRLYHYDKLNNKITPIQMLNLLMLKIIRLFLQVELLLINKD